MNCDNCGHPSHCGTPLMKTNDEGSQYEVCKHCRCEECTPKE